jgi:hypothetical protein
VCIPTEMYEDWGPNEDFASEDADYMVNDFTYDCDDTTFSRHMV